MKLTRVTLATATSVLLLAALAACGGNDDTAASAAEGGQAAGGQQQSAAPGGQTRMPGASGTVAAVSGSTAQVQNDQSGQVAVTWTATTVFTHQVDAALADVEVGACVAVTSDGATTTDDGPVAATSVRITAATDDGCAAGFGAMGGGPGGGRPSGAPSDLPSDRPSDLPSDLPSDRAGGPGGGRAGGTFGEVTAVSADGFTVSSTRPGEDATTTVEVTVAGATTYTTTAAASSSAVKIGACVTATGTTDGTGAVTATRVSVSDAVDGQCGGGFMRPAGGKASNGSGQ
ncbi:DUF5666 domain-containing protein [Nocardioides sp. URHA0020]|uniref:DUF5666 domain-containing protein n=1 Tax=Nocardioides sp. URHA0020 TaxID=1380392 RepID=UPI000A89B1C1|nr:DUF5666 domain-containing protein [Nocardioides sp. URHA0020]